MAELLTLLISITASILLYILLPPLLDGIERKIRADIQSRIGPSSVLQTWYDILKLLSKEVITFAEPKYLVISISLSLSLTILLAAILSYVTALTLIDAPHIALILVIATSIHTLGLLAYLFSSNPFSFIGVFRAVTIDIVNEVGLAISLVLTYISGLKRVTLNNIPLSLIALASLIVAVYVSSRRLPYDLPEAEPELASGTIIEFSGPILGIYVYNHLLERYMLTSIPIMLALWTVRVQLNNVIMLLLLHVFTSTLYIVFAIVGVVLGRSRVNIAVKTLTFLYSLTIVIWLGAYILEQIFCFR